MKHTPNPTKKSGLGKAVMVRSCGIAVGHIAEFGFHCGEPAYLFISQDEGEVPEARPIWKRLKNFWNDYDNNRPPRQ